MLGTVTALVLPIYLRPPQRPSRYRPARTLSTPLSTILPFNLSPSCSSLACTRVLWAFACRHPSPEPPPALLGRPEVVQGGSWRHWQKEEQPSKRTSGAAGSFVFTTYWQSQCCALSTRARSYPRRCKPHVAIPVHSPHEHPVSDCLSSGIAPKIAGKPRVNVQDLLTQCGASLRPPSPQRCSPYQAMPRIIAFESVGQAWVDNDMVLELSAARQGTPARSYTGELELL
ncbi:uncharacterized protein C8Q71DRAFT_777953 [Rhodofomes roseus]|uniref:Uncharacterized protein n=1 Tax=Rhodofomes roseus TaxID=34475 RepID=A0ABQ8K5F6_9APHY|nr:uncharacterized protein C8Q71DRAFT_777953 [Rhodofomes roseus]KAH9832222.1 hypothetical protein C8Q71DRAFT_777953 [Rhodofomes roseus]